MLRHSRLLFLTAVGLLLGVSLAHAQPRLGVQTFSSPGGGLRVFSVLPGSPANGNLFVGNTLLTVDGKFLTTPSNLRDGLAAAGDKATLIVMRPGSGFVQFEVPLISPVYMAAPGSGPRPTTTAAAPAASKKWKSTPVTDPRRRR